MSAIQPRWGRCEPATYHALQCARFAVGLNDHPMQGGFYGSAVRAGIIFC